MRSGRGAAAVAIVAALTLGTVLITGAEPASATTGPVRTPTVIASGNYFTVAVTPAGKVRAWGDNQYGALGDDTTDASLTPVTVVGVNGLTPLNRVVEVAAGRDTAYALRANGTVVAWGEGDNGALGNGQPATNTTYTTRPVQVVSLSGAGTLTGVVSIAAGNNFAIALRKDGSVVAWGADYDGQLGDGQPGELQQPPDSDRPVLTQAAPGPQDHGGQVVAVAAGAQDGYLVEADGYVQAWGDDRTGELGDDYTFTTRDFPFPVFVDGTASDGLIGNVVSVAAGNGFVLVLQSDGTVLGWGTNTEGQLGDGTETSRGVAEPVADLDNVAAVGVGDGSSTPQAVTTGGLVFAWGENYNYEVGDGTDTNRTSAESIGRIGRTGSGVQLTSAARDDFYVTAGGTVYGRGYGPLGQLGNGSPTGSTSPTPPTGLGRIALPELFLLRAPVLSGDARIHQTLKVTSGRWGLPATQYAYRWLRDGKAIRGAVRSHYKITPADRDHYVSVRVSATRAGYPTHMITTRRVFIRR